MSGIDGKAVFTALMSAPEARFLIQSLAFYTVFRLVNRCAPVRDVTSQIMSALLFVAPLAFLWLYLVNKNVPESYLDEIFHIPQAQVYCEGRFFEWDDKITTPPGLYLATIIYNAFPSFACSVANLRTFNAFVVTCISGLVVICRAMLLPNSDASRQLSANDLQTACNITLFPVLFFFSGLYYTDPASTLIVLVAYANHLGRIRALRTSFLNDVWTIILGILTLGFRQTNIFWVVVYMGGLEVVHDIRTWIRLPAPTPKFRSTSEQIAFYVWRYSLGEIHDPPLNLAQPVDVVLCVLSIGVAALCNLPRILHKFLWPHGVVLASFAAFVAWNGGVVLGDKSNHVATLHLAQLLYIWPFFAFFSATILVPQLLNLAKRVYGALIAPQSINKPALKSTVLVSIGAITAGLLIVHFNTIIHPFTLADNRHYMFYVFRYSILRIWWIRYALVPVYIGCAWLCWSALQGAPKTLQPVPSSKNPVPASLPPANVAPTISTVLLLLLTTSLSLMTAPLVEPRYFILPWVFWRLLVPPPTVTNRDTVSKPFDLETGWFILINIFTMHAFLTKPFQWKLADGMLLDEGRLQRFMW